MSETVNVQVRDAQGKDLAEKAVSSSVFDAKADKGLIHQAVRWQLARKRSGTHSVLNRKVMKGGGAKPWRQKGTGRARAGTNVSPVWVGGAVAHGPKPRSYEFDMNKKERRAALRGALSTRRREGGFVCVDSFPLQEIKTKEAVKFLEGLGVSSKALVVLPDSETPETAFKSLRNIERVKPITVSGLNVYDVVHADSLVFIGSALEETQERLS